jgi:uncharacterized membrane protein HdeD (DUF308 family)
MSTTSGTNLFPHLWKSVLLTGILSVILGVMMLAWPGPTLVVAAIFFGAYLLVTGISQIFHAFTLHISGGGRALLFISGAASLVLAVLAIRHIGDAILLLAIWIGIGFVFRGVATAASAIAITTPRRAAGRSSSGSSPSSPASSCWRIRSPRWRRCSTSRASG